MAKAVKEKTVKQSKSPAASLRELNREELLKKLEETTKSLDAFFNLPAEKIEKPRQKSALKKERARILTLLQEKA
jgi:ribosomal protein L29